MLASPNLRSRRPIYRTFDHQVQDNTVTGPGFDAALLRVPGTSKGLALTTDGNPWYVALDPYEGTKAAVAEAARNIVCTGARPIAVTNCLNFGNPERPVVFGQLQESVRGLADACRALVHHLIGAPHNLLFRSLATPAHQDWTPGSHFDYLVVLARIIAWIRFDHIGT